MGAGDLFYKVAFAKRGATSDGAGGTQSAFADQFTIRAQFTHLRGGEAIMASRLEGKHTQVIRVRASAQTRQVTTDWRLTDARSGEIYNIRDVTMNKDRKFIDFLCESGAGA